MYSITNVDTDEILNEGLSKGEAYEALFDYYEEGKGFPVSDLSKRVYYNLPLCSTWVFGELTIKITKEE